MDNELKQNHEGRLRKENNVSTYMEKLFKSEEKKSHHNKQENIKEHKRLLVPQMQ